MIIKRAKGHGLHATFSVELPLLARGWHIKLRPASEGEQLINEAERLRWASNHLPTPQSAHLVQMPGMTLLITRTLEGEPSYKYIDVLAPQQILAGISAAVHIIRSADVHDFPFSPSSWATQEGAEANLGRLEAARDRHSQLHPDFAGKTLDELRAIVAAGAGDNSQVLSHGDFCMPNVLLDAEGSAAGIVDLGALHVGHAALDLAIMSWTIEANMGKGWADHFLAMHDMTADDQAIVYSRLVYDLGLERPDPWAWTLAPELVAQRERLSEQVI